MIRVLPASVVVPSSAPLQHRFYLSILQGVAPLMEVFFLKSSTADNFLPSSSFENDVPSTSLSAKDITPTSDVAVISTAGNDVDGISFSNDEEGRKSSAFDDTSTASAFEGDRKI